MGKLLRKEFSLSMHPTVLMFLMLSALLMVPNYPYYVTFFYTSLGIFFICLTGRENNDVFYTMLLPVSKKSIVKARFTFVVIIEALQVIIAVPFALIRQSFNMPGNQVGMDANIALFGLSFIMLGLFNLIFFGIYYRNVDKVGTAFLVSSAVVFIYICVVEALDHILPLFKDKLDTPDTMFVTEKLIVLGIGISVFAVLTVVAYMKAVKDFEKLDI